MKTYEIIYNPVITEKATLMQEAGQYAFWVSKKATKVDIKNALKKLYGVKVSDVRLMSTPEKSRRIRYGSMVKRNEQRKAYITLEGKAKLDTTKFGKEKSSKDVVVKSDAKKKEAKAKKTTKKES